MPTTSTIAISAARLPPGALLPIVVGRVLSSAFTALFTIVQTFTISLDE